MGTHFNTVKQGLKAALNLIVVQHNNKSLRGAVILIVVQQNRGCKGGVCKTGDSMVAMSLFEL